MDAIEVTGKRNANTDRRDASASKIIITREDIEQYGDSNLGDVMRRLPGVTQGGRPGRGGPVRMRGMGGGFTQMLINGERIPPGFSIEQITPDQVERIEILRAPTAETGARAIAGTINIVLREALRARNSDLRAGLVFDHGRTSPEVSFTHNDTLSATGTYNVTAALRRVDQITDTATRTLHRDLPSGLTTLEQDGTSQVHEKRDSVFLNARLQWRLGAGEQFSFQPFLVFNDSHTRSAGSLDQSVGATPARYATQLTDGTFKFNVARFMTMLNKRFDDKTTFELRGGAGQFSADSNSQQQQFNALGSRVLVQSTDGDIRDRSGNVTGKVARSWGEGHLFSSGAELERARRKENSLTLLDGVQQLADYGTDFNVTTTRKALYVQDEWDPAPQWSSSLGLRWEGIETRSSNDLEAVQNKSSVLSPLAHGVWRFAAPSRDQIRVSLTQSYRPPTPQNLVSRPTLNTLFPVPGPNTSVAPDRAGNPHLQPERANGIDIAYENYLEKGGVIGINLFSRRIQDLIRNVTVLEVVPWAASARYVARPQNLGRASTSGIEFDAKFSLPEVIANSPAVNVRANLSLFRSRVNDIPGPDNRIADQPKATANLGADYKFRGSPFSVGGTLAWTPAYNLRVADDQAQTHSTKRVFDAYVLWNIADATRLRLSLSNLAPRDSISGNVFTLPGEEQSVLTTGKTHLSTALRLEMRL